MIYELIKLTRPSHLVKNFFVFLPIFFGQKMFDTQLLFNAFMAFLAFCFAASSIYCFNDIKDVEEDRRHSVKCKRPVASGKISVPAAYAIMFILLAMSMGVLYFISDDAIRYKTMAVTIFYWLMEIAYCLFLKRFAIVDVCILSFGFVLRILVGGVATGIVISQWLVMMTFLLTLFLAIAKRRDDVIRMTLTGTPARHNTKRYNLVFVNESLTVTGSVMLVCYIMYTVSEQVVARMGSEYLYITSVFVLAGIIRYLQVTIVDVKSGNPIKVLMKDHFIQICIVAWILTFVFILYI
jgi:4-hydroxybenzoate polyprenyltransferase